MTVIDAGSSGCRAHVFKFVGGSVEPEHENLKVRPGLSSFANEPTQAGKSLEPLLEFMRNEIPEESRGESPIYLKATAGLRMIDETSSAAVLESVRRALESSEFGDVKAEIISGLDEASFGWLTINYLSNTLEGGEEIATVELGGASAQVAQAHSPGQAQIEVGGKSKDLFAVSYLGYGQEKAREGLTQYLKERGEISDPCLPRGFPAKGGVYDPIPTGGGSYDQCRLAVEAALFYEGAWCEEEDCGEDEQRAKQKRPPGNILKSSSVLVFENFYYTAAMLGILSDNHQEVSVEDYAEAARPACESSWNDLEASAYPHDNSPKSDLDKLCFSSIYIDLFLTRGLGISRDKKFTVARQIKGNDIDWSLGAAIREASVISY